MHIYKWFRVLRTALLSLISGVMILSSPVHAADDVFTVSDVKVDVTAENAVAAREKAFSLAQVQAFRALAQKLLGESDFKSYKTPDAAMISTMIKDFEITNERLSAVQYIGTYTFRFEGSAVRSHFNTGGGVRYSDVTRKPVLVLPFFQNGTRTILWQDDNPWLAAWANTPVVPGALVPVAVPLGDIGDVADIGDNESLTYSREGLQSITARYGASDAVVLVATPERGADDMPAGLSVMMYRTDTYMPQHVRTLHVTGTENVDVYAKAVAEVRDAIQSDWKAEMAVNPVTQSSAMMVRVRFQTMQQWIETRQAMMRVQGISDIKVRSVTPREAQVDLRFAGDENRLRLAMAQADLVLGPAGPGAGPAYGYVSAMAYDVYLAKYTPY